MAPEDAPGRGRLSRWVWRWLVLAGLAALAGLAVLFAGAGDSPTPEQATGTPPPPPSETPLPRPTEAPAGTESLSDPYRGFSLEYPAGWVYEDNGSAIFFAESQGALGTTDPAEGPALLTLFGQIRDIEGAFGEAVTVQQLFDSVRERWCAIGTACELGGVEERSFGDTPGMLGELSYLSGDVLVEGYLVAALGEEVAGTAFGGAPAEMWDVHEPVLRAVFDSLELFPPEKRAPTGGGEIQPGETVSGMLPADGLHAWSFEALAGQYVTLQLDAVDEGLDTYLELYDDEDDLIAEDDDRGAGTNSVIGEELIRSDGTHYAYVSPFGGEGAYTLSLAVADAPSGGGEIGYGETVTGTLPLGVAHMWLFEGEAGDVVTIAMNATDDELDCYVLLYGPEDDLLTDHDDVDYEGGNLDALIAGFELEVDGVYRIAATSGLGGEQGSYELVLGAE